MLAVALSLMLVRDCRTPDGCRSQPITIESIIPCRPAESDRWLALDKFWHVSASFVTVGATYHLCANRLNLDSPWPATVALGATPCLGVAKEFIDLAGPSRHFSWKDLAADALGLGLGYLAFIHKW